MISGSHKRKPTFCKYVRLLIAEFTSRNIKFKNLTYIARCGKNMDWNMDGECKEYVVDHLNYYLWNTFCYMLYFNF